MGSGFEWVNSFFVQYVWCEWPNSGWFCVLWRCGLIDKPVVISTLVWGEWRRYLTDFPPSQNAAQGHFEMGSHAWIETHAWPDQKMLGSVGIPLLGCPAMNSALQSRFCLENGPLKPDGYEETLHTTYMEHVRKDGILPLSQPTCSCVMNCDLSDITPCQNMVQHYFMVGAAHKLRLVHNRCRNSWPLKYSSNGVPQALTYKISPASRQRPEENGSLRARFYSRQTQLPSMNTKHHPEGKLHGELSLSLWVPFFYSFAGERILSR